MQSFDLDPEPSRPSQIKTLLSTKPRDGSALPGLFSMIFFLVFSLFYWFDSSGWSDLLSANPEKVYGQHEYWRLFTAIAVHGDIQHLAANAGFFVGLAFLLNAYFGKWVFPVMTFFLGAVINAIALFPSPPQVQLVGASGVVYFMAAFWLTLYFFVERHQPVSRRLMSCVAVTLVLLVPTSYEPMTSYRTHAIGFLVGLASGGSYFLLKKNELRNAEIAPEPDPEPTSQFAGCA